MTSNLGGWTLVTIPELGAHIVPLNDTADHMDENCPCNPKQETDINLWTHNSFDGREEFETGERIPS